MKTFLKNWGYFLITLIMIIIAIPEKMKAQNGADISFQTFYDELSPYGEWIDDPEYGYVWVPDAEADFQPYATQGHWVTTQYGNTWVSDYEWGWAPFHYGRWRHSNHYGWQWIPGSEWGPAWVSWRNGGGYYGWAPLAPRISINVSFGRHYSVPHNYWVFVPQQYICDPRMGRYYVPRRNNVTIINNTTIIQNTYVRNNQTYISGPGRRDIERVTRNRVNVYTVQNDKRPGRTSIQDGAVNVYRPEVRPSRTDEPRKVVRSTDRPSRAVASGSSNNALDNRNVRTGNATLPNQNNGNTRPTRPAKEVTRPDNEANKSFGNSSQRPVNGQNQPKETAEQPTNRPSRTVDRPTRTTETQQKPASNQTQREERPAARERAVDQQRPQPRQSAPQTQRATPSAQRTERVSRPESRSRPTQTSQARPSRSENR